MVRLFSSGESRRVGPRMGAAGMTRTPSTLRYNMRLASSNSQSGSSLEVAMKLVAVVVELLDGGEDPLARLVSDIGVAAERAGDGHDADPCRFCDVTHAGGSCHGKSSPIRAWSPMTYSRRDREYVPGAKAQTRGSLKCPG